MTDGRRTGVHDEPSRDPRLGHAIRQAEGPPAGEARLELLRARIAAASEAAMRAPRDRPWWEWTARWARTELAVSVAACAAALILAVTTGAPGSDGAGDSAAATAGAPSAVVDAPISPNVGVDSIVTGAVAAGATSDQVMAALLGDAGDADWLFQSTVRQAFRDP